MPKSSRRPPRKREIPLPSALSAEHTPALTGDSVTPAIRFRSTTIIVLIITSKMGRLTFPISGYQRHGFSRAPQITSFRNSWIPLISCYCRNSFSLRKPDRFVINLHLAPTHRTDGRLWIVLAFWNIDDINKIVELLEPNPLMLRTWFYFGHCQWTARELEKEVRYQKDSAESLLMELWHLGIDEILHPIIAEARQLERRATQFAQSGSIRTQPISPIIIRLPAQAPTLPTPTLPTDSTTNYSTEADTGGPSRLIIIVDNNTTTPPTTSTSSSGPPFKKRRGTPWRTSNYVRHKWQATPNLGSSGLERG